MPFLREVQTFPNGQLLYEHCDKFGFEGIVSKRLSARYVSGPSRHWTNTKCPNWKRLNAIGAGYLKPRAGPNRIRVSATSIESERNSPGCGRR